MSLASSALALSMQRQAKHQFSTTDRVTNALATVTSVEGEFLVDGSGEASKTVQFPTRFIERPNFTFGGELHLDTSAVAGSFPTVSCVISRWLYTTPVPGKIYFHGADLLIVTTGPAAQRMWIHWRVTARAIVSPISGGTGTTTNTTI